MRPQRALVDWDFAASGIWYLRQPGVDKPADPWSPLPDSLVTDLQAWNHRAESIPPADDGAWSALRTAGRRLALQVQEALGDNWQVLYNSSEGSGWAWTWVIPPWDTDRAATPR